MSCDVNAYGKLIPFKFSSSDLKWEEKILELRSKGHDIDFDKVDDFYSEKIKIYNGIFYEVNELNENYDPDPHFTNVTVDKEGIIEFDCLYYNGGTCWDELVEEQLNIMERETNDYNI
jgi:hypothetical protein